MKKTFFKAALALLLVCAAVFCFASCGNNAAKVEDAESAEGSFDGIEWSYDADDNTLTIEGEGAISFESAAAADWFDVRHSVKTIEFDTDGITEIGDYAFYNMIALEEIDIPDTVTALGDYAFAFCSKLPNIDGQLPVGLETIGKGCFESCVALEAINVPSTVTSIGERAFAHCAALKTADISATLSELAAWTFKGCSSLDTLTMYSANKDITVDPTAFEDCGVEGMDGVSFSEARDGQFILTIKYVYADGSEAAPTVEKTLAKNEYYEETAPTIEGYDLDKTVIDGYISENKTIKFTYKEHVEETEAQTEEADAAADAEQTAEDEPENKVGSIIAIVVMVVVILAIVALVVFMVISDKKNAAKAGGARSAKNNGKNGKNNKNGKRK